MASGPRKPIAWRTGVCVAAVWLILNAGVYVTLQSLEQRAAQPSAGLSQHVLEAFEPRQLTRGSTANPVDQIVHYRLMRPASPSYGRMYPVVLFLHGAGQCGTDNCRQLTGLPEQMSGLPWRDDFPCFFIAPQCPRGQNWSGEIDVLIAILEDVVASHPVDRRRIYLTGLSMGGFGTWQLAAKFPELFAAVVPICGGGDPAIAQRLVNIPIWAVHGDADDSVPVERSRIMIEAVRAAGGRPRFNELPGVGHDSWTPAYRDRNGVIPWMFQQAKSVRDTSQ